MSSPPLQSPLRSVVPIHQISFTGCLPSPSSHLTQAPCHFTPTLFERRPRRPAAAAGTSPARCWAAYSPPQKPVPFLSLSLMRRTDRSASENDVVSYVSTPAAGKQKEKRRSVSACQHHLCRDGNSFCEHPTVDSFLYYRCCCAGRTSTLILCR
ncbi:uncharacterized protein EI97DRAFT_223849 [Westerdykella ornata]|uniref:Uncharacterized protein n=1 Tax=Westerdykella ornata TaxID=318751 RepID=A0A6A6JV77_WESOR|nr:uncharacterized protein EI97DRAFT_223849 [Westerdykella ornata]KAF2278939.1 hypothetical protein EI97DRAFT_223849 [Westerdykella ornata]